jgi:outer membrane lipoprotein SlyB
MDTEVCIMRSIAIRMWKDMSLVTIINTGSGLVDMLTVRERESLVVIAILSITHAPQKQHQTDDNSCIEGSILGGILGGGAGAAASRGDGRLWAIPLGIVGGALVGCQVDGG